MARSNYLADLSRFNLVLILVMMLPFGASAQTYQKLNAGTLTVGANTAINSKAVLDARSTTQGALIPRMTTAQRDAITSPTTGLLLYNSSTNFLSVFNGSFWLETATLTGSETLTNKSISGLTNTLTNITASTNANLTGPITSVGNATSVASQTGTGSVFVMQASPTLTTPVFSTISNTGTLTLPTSTDTLIGRATTDTLTNKSISGLTNTLTNITANTNANLTGPITSVGNATAVASQTGTGSVFVMQATPTLTTPVIGAATGTSLSVSGQLTSTVATGTAPLVVSSTTEVANLKAATATNLSGGSGGTIPYQSAAATTLMLANGTSGQVLQSGGGTSAPSWVTAASGGKNYITNNEATTDTSGWATYADAAAASPVDGTGGTPSSTFARNATTPLRGSGDFLWTHSAANRQGEGFSYDFTIDAADKGKVLQGSFDYKIASGTFADNDLVVWIYDVTNATLIQPAPYLIKNHLLAAERFPFEFQTSSSSVSYRLIVHVATATATAYTMQLDNFTVGPNAKLYGSPIIDVVSKTMTLTNAGNATVTARMSKVGDIAWFQGTIVMGSSLPTGSITLNMPTGMTIDTAKSAGLTVGIAGASNSGGTGSYTGQARVETSTAVIFYGDSNAAIWNATVPRTFAQNDRIDFTFPVAIVGWSSSVIMSNDADTRVVAARYTGTASTTPTSLTAAIVKMSTLVTDTHGAYSTSTGLYTVPLMGLYQVTVQYHISQSATAVTNAFDSQIVKNGTIVAAQYQTAYTTSSVEHAPGIKALVSCIAGDTIAAYIGQNLTGTNLTIGNSVRTYIDIQRISGPAQIGASEFIAPTVQKLTSGSTYTLPLLPRMPKYIRVRLIGGGGGGGGSGTSGTAGGSDGGSTTFGSSLLTANGGGKAASGTPPTGASGGTATVASPAINIITTTGGSGGGSSFTASAVSRPGAVGASSPFGAGGQSSMSAAGGSAVANTGAGGGGGGIDGTVSIYTGASGASGGYLEAIIASPSATYAYAVGASGTAGASGSGGYAGGAGAAGIIVVEEYYQ